MKALLQNKSINNINLIGMFFTTILLILSITIIIFNSYSQYKSDIQSLEQNYIKSQKQFVEQETKRVLRYIIYKNKYNKNISIKKLQTEIVNTVKQMRNRRDGTGYVFIYTLNGVNVADPILTKNEGKNLLNFKDKNGKKVIKELIDISQNDNGGYVNYVWNKPTTNMPAPKISYAISYKPWNWMIGSGIYLDDIQDVIQKKKDEYYNKISSYLIQTISLVIIIFIIGYLTYRYLMSLIKNDIQNIAIASKDLENINTNDISFKEFKNVAFHINSMNDELQYLNKNLENKVTKRTQELETAKEYAYNLVQQQDKFVKDAIHEINTPLSIIITNIDLFKLKFSENKYLSKIEAGSKIIHNIYNDLEYMVKKDRIEYPFNTINLSDFIKYRVDFFNEIAIGNNLYLSSDIEENISINFNDTLLQRICDNTISNAIKYSFKEKSINIRLYIKNNNIVFKVTNEGETIKDVNKLFDRFYRENNSRGGFGLGLNIIKEICDKNNINLEVISKDNIIIFKYLFTMENR